MTKRRRYAKPVHVGWIIATALIMALNIYLFFYVVGL